MDTFLLYAKFSAATIVRDQVVSMVDVSHIPEYYPVPLQHCHPPCAPFVVCLTAPCLRILRVQLISRNNRSLAWKIKLNNIGTLFCCSILNSPSLYKRLKRKLIIIKNLEPILTPSLILAPTVRAYIHIYIYDRLFYRIVSSFKLNKETFKFVMRTISLEIKNTEKKFGV